MANKTSGPPINSDELRARFQRERDKRLNPSGADQYVFSKGRFADFSKDPYVSETIERPALNEALDVLVIGAGLGGLQMAIQLVKKGISNIRLVDTAGDFGGTWYWNRYPGLRCDVDAYIYLPLLEETGYIPTERFARGSEIFDYCRQLGQHFDIYKHALFQTTTTSMAWDAASARWIVTTSRGDTFKAKFVTTQSGGFNRPQLPGVDGIDSFKGRAFHSARWDYEYTGGSTSEPLVKLAGKRVGIIGTGATAVQVVPEVAKAAKSLTIFQRTPTAVTQRFNQPTDKDWFTAQALGWQEQRQRSFTKLFEYEDADCPVNDGWTHFFRGQLAAIAELPQAELTPEAIAKVMELNDFEHTDRLRARVDEYVRDPAKAELLKAWYRTMCKRLGFSDDYLPACDRDNVSIVDVSGGDSCKIERITEKGVVVGDIEYELDCLIYCTGFELGTTWVHQAGYDVIGSDGEKLSEKWAQGPKTNNGFFSQGFPNIFFMGVTQSASGISLPYALGKQSEHLAHIIDYCLTNNIQTVETTSEAEADWQAVMAGKNEIRRPFQEACSPGYLNAEGRQDDHRNTASTGIYFPATELFDNWQAWREQGGFSGLVLSK